MSVNPGTQCIRTLFAVQGPGEFVMFLVKRHASEYAEQMTPGWTVVEREWELRGERLDWHDHTIPYYVYMVCEGDRPVCEGDRPVFYTRPEADAAARVLVDGGRKARVDAVEVWVGAKS